MPWTAPAPCPVDLPPRSAPPISSVLFSYLVPRRIPHQGPRHVVAMSSGHHPVYTSTRPALMNRSPSQHIASASPSQPSTVRLYLICQKNIWLHSFPSPFTTLAHVARPFLTFTHSASTSQHLTSTHFRFKASEGATAQQCSLFLEGFRPPPVFVSPPSC